MPKRVVADSLPVAPGAATPADVARRAGVSLVTVSRALNDSPRVSPETRDRVIAAARELGYRPNSTARALRKGKTNAVAVVLKVGHLFGPFYSELLAGFYSVARQHDLRVMLTVVPTEEENSGVWLPQLLSEADFDAVILHQELARQVGSARLLNFPVPVVLAGILADATPEEQAVPMAGYDHAGGISQAVRHLAALGHRDLAYLHTPGSAFGPSIRPRAFRETMAELGIPVREEWMLSLPPGDDTERGCQTIQAVFSGRPPYPTAVICASDEMAAGVIEGASAWGLRVPEDLSVVGYLDSPWATAFRPAITSVHQRGWDLGEALGKKLVALRERRPEGGGTTVLPMKLIVRRSTAAPPARGKKIKN